MPGPLCKVSILKREPYGKGLSGSIAVSKLRDKGVAVAVIINRGELYPCEWLRQFNARLVEWPGARKALETLERKGFQREVLLRDLYKYVTSSQTLEPRRVAARRACREIQSCLEELERASAALSSLRSN